MMREYWKSLFDTYARLAWDRDPRAQLSKEELRLWKDLKEGIPEAYRNANTEQVEELRDILTSSHEFRKEKIFAAYVLKSVVENGAELSEDFFMPLIEASLAECNPSVNRVYVEPCVMAFGRKRTQNEFRNRKKFLGDKDLNLQVKSALYWTEDH